MNDELDQTDESTVIAWAVRAIRMGTNRYFDSLVADLLESKSATASNTDSGIPDNFEPARAVRAFLTAQDEELSSRALSHLQAAISGTSHSSVSHKVNTGRVLQDCLEHHEDHEGRIQREFHPIYERRLKQLFQLFGEWIGSCTQGSLEHSAA